MNNIYIALRATIQSDNRLSSVQTIKAKLLKNKHFMILRCSDPVFRNQRLILQLPEILIADKETGEVLATIGLNEGYIFLRLGSLLHAQKAYNDMGTGAFFEESADLKPATNPP